MTFNQWAALYRLDRSLRISLEAIWNEMFGAGLSPGSVKRLMDDLMEGIQEQYE